MSEQNIVGYSKKLLFNYQAWFILEVKELFNINFFNMKTMY